MKYFFVFVFIFLLNTYLYSQRAQFDIDINRQRDPNYISRISEIVSGIDTLNFANYPIYVYKDYICGGQCDSLYEYIKFINDSVLFMSFFYYSFPSKIDIFDFTYGNFGKYKVIDNEICFNIYANKSLKFVLQCGLIYDNVVVVYNFPGKRSRKKKLRGDEFYFYKYSKCSGC